MKKISTYIIEKTGKNDRALMNYLKPNATKKGIWYYTEFEGIPIRFRMEAIPFYGLPKRYCPKGITIEKI